MDLRASTWKKVFLDALKLHAVQRDQLISVDLGFDKVGLGSNVSFVPLHRVRWSVLCTRDIGCKVEKKYEWIFFFLIFENIGEFVTT